MPRVSRRHVRPLAVLLLALLAVPATSPHVIAQTGERWIGTWATSPVPPLPASFEPPKGWPARPAFHDQTLRQIVHVSLGGDVVRVRLSNEYGTEPLAIGKAHLAIRGEGSAIVPASDRMLTFSGRPSIRVPAGAVALSDPVTLHVPAAADLAVSLYLPDTVREVTWHQSALQTSYVSRAGDFTAAPSLRDATTVSSWFFLTGVAVTASARARTIVALGDSITDGASSKADTNGRWPDVLAKRLLAAKRPLAVVNAGIGGNRILHDGRGGIRTVFGVNALARFDRDVLAQPGVGYVIVLLGINDIGHPGTPDVAAAEDVSADDVIAGLRQLVERAHAHGLRILGATLTPFEGTAFPGYYTPAKEAKRQTINAWIRTGKAFDGVIDFDRAVRDPEHPARILPTYDGGDHLHPSDAGMRVMAEAVDLALFESGSERAPRRPGSPPPPAPR